MKTAITFQYVPVNKHPGQPALPALYCGG